MVFIAIFSGLFLGGAALAVVKQVGQSSKSHNKELHIV
jgi:formate-dependent nitrite reductase membrane component NrfD